MCKQVAGCWPVLALDGRGRVLPLLEGRDAAGGWLARPGGYGPVRGLTFRKVAGNAGVEQLFGVSPGALPAATLGYPVNTLEFCGRNLVLAGVLNAEFGVRAPLLAEPPTLRLARCQAAGAATGEVAPVVFLAE